MAYLDYGADKTLLFNGHSDTTNVDFMKNPFSGEIKGNFLYGRGAADMKGGLAAVMYLFKYIKKTRQNPGINLAFAVTDGEEGGGSPGAIKLAKKLDANYCIVSEPTELKIYDSCKGIYFLKLESYGKSAHLSAPSFGNNAIDNLLGAYDYIKNNYIDNVTKRSNQNSLFVTCSIKGGSEGIPDYAEMLINRRVLAGESAKRDINAINALLENFYKSCNSNADIKIKKTVDFGPERSPMLTPKNKNFTNLCIEVYNKISGTNSRPMQHPGWTEGAIFRAAGIDAIIAGPGSVEYAHTPFEKVDIRELGRAVQIYALIVKGLGQVKE